MKTMRELLVCNVPRRISGRLSTCVHVYVDASYESSGYSGVGGVIYSSTGECLSLFSEKVDRVLLEKIMHEGQETAIQELEGFALLIALETFSPHLEGTRVILFSDSDAVRGAFLKNWSSNQNCSKILSKVFTLEEMMQLQIWIERVPSQSNLLTSFPGRKSLNSMEFRELGLSSTKCGRRWSKSRVSARPISDTPSIPHEKIVLLMWRE